MTLERPSRNSWWRRTAAAMGAVGVATACLGTEAPVITSLSPNHGVPGTEVTITGERLGSPLVDAAAKLRFGKVTIVAANEDPHQGLIIEWGPRRIVFLTPLDETQSGPRDVVVVTRNGESAPARFQVEGEEDRRPSFVDFVGGVVANAAEAVVFTRLHKVLDEDPRCTGLGVDCDPEPDLEQAPIENQDFVTYSFAQSGYTSSAADVRIAKNEDFDGAVVAVERTAATAEFDGIAELLVLDDSYGIAVTSYDSGANPQRFVSRALGSNNQEVLLLSGTSGAMDEYYGSRFNEFGTELALLGLGGDVRPDAAFFYSAATLVVAGHRALDGSNDTWLAWIDRDADQAGSLPLVVPAARAADVALVVHDRYDEASSTYTYVEDYYVAYNPIDPAAPSALARYRSLLWANTVSSGVTEAVSTLNFPAGYRVNAMVYDGVSELIESLQVYGPPPTDATATVQWGIVPAPRLWLALDAGAETGLEDMIVGLLQPHAETGARGEEFPAVDGAVIEYADWTAQVAADAAAAISAAAAAATTVTEAVFPSPKPVTPFTEIRYGDGDAAIADPVALSVVPQGHELGPTFILVSNAGRDSLAVIRADVAPIAGWMYGEIALPVGGLGRLYCTERAADAP